jgi:hypothetical protein
MPFRFGIAEMRSMPHVLVRVSLECGGVVTTGFSADHLVPKWFTKNPQTTYQEDILELQQVVLTAGQIAEKISPQPTPFRLWWEIYQEQARRSESQGWPPLLGSLGASLIERALIDAFCRREKKPFQAVLRENSLGLDLGMIYPELKGREPAEFLPSTPATSSEVRHTVGLSDPLTDRDLATGEWPDDGLPVSLEASIRRYGISSFKIKISDDTSKNIERLSLMLPLLERNLPGGYSFSLDGNESYRSIEDFGMFWDRLLATPDVARHLDRLLFVEQPLHREVALQAGVGRRFEGSARPPRLIIDESDATLQTLATALACGYVGTTHKNCKGVFKSVANLALLKIRCRSSRDYIFSGEDLTNVGPIALLEDLCVAQNLGITNIERNGHHYFKGLANFPRAMWRPILAAHPDLYEELPDGCPTVKIQRGRMNGASLHQVGLGPAFDPEVSSLTPLEEWKVESLPG